VIETDATTAEVAKLAENTFRDVNIAFANQLVIICEGYGVDVKKVIKLANTQV
jgi:UDP-N-acetyl-D-mannosaminuronic acid dehydrogenase